MEKMPTYLRRGALLLAILLATIIATGTAGLLLLLQYHRQYAANNMRHERLRQNLASATNLLLTDNPATPADTLALHLFYGDRDSVRLASPPWGAFKMAPKR